MNFIRRSARLARNFKPHKPTVGRQFLAGLQRAQLHDRPLIRPCRPLIKPRFAATGTVAGFIGLSVFDQAPLDILDGKAMMDFKIGGLLGWGGCSTVWTVTEKDGKKYALKAMPIDSHEFEIRMREIEAMKKVQGSENVLEFHEAWLEKMTPKLEEKFVPFDAPVYQYASCQYMMFIKTELCDTNLSDWMRRKSRRNSQIWSVFRQVTQGIKELHDNKIMHRDIKPANIFINFDKETNQVSAKLGDLGLAKHSNQTGRTGFIGGDPMLMATTPSVTSDVGTYAYMAPEQRRSQYDLKVDMYALGMLLWEMNAMEQDMDGRHEALMHTRSTGKVGKFTKVKMAKSIAFIEKLIQRNPSNRPTATELLNSLDTAEL